MTAMKLNDFAKRIAAQMKLSSRVVRAVLESKKTDLPRAAVTQITEAARTLIHEELMRLDARHHPEGPKSAPRRGATAASRRDR